MAQKGDSGDSRTAAHLKQEAKIMPSCDKYDETTGARKSCTTAPGLTRQIAEFSGGL